MRISVPLIFAVICLAAAGCKNEPYAPAAYGITTLLNHESNATLTFRYRDQKVYTFMSRTTADTLANIKFNFQGDLLTSMVSDSTSTSRKFTSVYNFGGSVVTDSTSVIEGIYGRKISARVVTYDEEGYPTSVDIKNWDDVFKEELAELTWEAGNVVRLATYDLTTGEKVLKTDVSISHDTEYCVYMKRPEYVYTLALTELYWLSKNNPISFNDGTAEKPYKFWYNKLGYPSNFKSDTGVIFGVTYTQVR